MAKRWPFLIQGRLSRFSRIMAAKNTKKFVFLTDTVVRNFLIFLLPVRKNSITENYEPYRRCALRRGFWSLKKSIYLLSKGLLWLYVFFILFLVQIIPFKLEKLKKSSKAKKRYSKKRTHYLIMQIKKLQLKERFRFRLKLSDFPQIIYQIVPYVPDFVPFLFFF